VLVEGHGHDTVSGEECLLHAVPMVYVDVNVQHAVVVLEQLQDGQHNVVDVAEAAGLWGRSTACRGVGLAPGWSAHKVVDAAGGIWPAGAALPTALR